MLQDTRYCQDMVSGEGNWRCRMRTTVENKFQKIESMNQMTIKISCGCKVEFLEDHHNRPIFDDSFYLKYCKKHINSELKVVKEKAG